MRADSCRHALSALVENCAAESQNLFGPGVV